MVQVKVKVSGDEKMGKILEDSELGGASKMRKSFSNPES